MRRRRGLKPDPGRDICISPALAGVDPADLHMPAAFDALAAPPVFLCGVARSGKTFTFDLFAGHPEVCGVFESWLLTQHTGLTGIFHQPQWHPGFYEHQLEQIGQPHAAVGLLPYAEMARELGDLIAGWLMRAVAPGQRHLVEATPIDVPAFAALFPRAKLIHVMRDGRDVIGSARRAAQSWAPEMQPDRSVAEQAASWSAQLRDTREQAEAIGDNYREMRFEDLRADLRGTITGLLDFAGIRWDDAVLTAMERAVEPEAYPAGARESGFRGRGARGGWRDWMSRSEGRDFDAQAGELLVELGYVESRDWWRELPTRPRPSR
jgi:hypothetical protein